MSLIFKNLSPLDRGISCHGSDLRSLILFFYTYSRFYPTFEQEDLQNHTCMPGKFRSINDCFSFVSTYRKETFDNVLLEVLKLSEEKILKGFFCGDIKRLNFLLRASGMGFDYYEEDSPHGRFSKAIYKGIILNIVGAKDEEGKAIFSSILKRIAVIRNDVNYIANYENL